jgi:hypothetical protein
MSDKTRDWAFFNSIEHLFLEPNKANVLYAIAEPYNKYDLYLYLIVIRKPRHKLRLITSSYSFPN